MASYKRWVFFMDNEGTRPGKRLLNIRKMNEKSVPLVLEALHQAVNSWPIEDLATCIKTPWKATREGHVFWIDAGGTPMMSAVYGDVSHKNGVIKVAYNRLNTNARDLPPGERFTRIEIEFPAEANDK